MRRGIKALERSAVGRSDLYSGQTAENLQKYGQDYAYSKYLPARQQEQSEQMTDFSQYINTRQQEEAENMNAFNQWVSGQLNPLQSLLGAGQSAAAGMANSAGQMAQGGSNLMNAGGQALASGQLGQAAAYQNMYSNIGQNIGNIGQGAGLVAGMFGGGAGGAAGYNPNANLGMRTLDSVGFGGGVAPW